MRKTKWAVIDLEHPEIFEWRGPCDECLALASAAIIDARSTGSVGSTRITSHSGKKTHSATVRRAIDVIEV
jgi:hypothetical protein